LLIVFLGADERGYGPFVRVCLRGGQKDLTASIARGMLKISMPLPLSLSARVHMKRGDS
jgi:hypothetical protein